MKLYVLLIAFLTAYVVLFPRIDNYSETRFEDRDIRYIPQNEMLDLSVLEFRDLASDMIFFTGLTFVGGRKPGHDRPEIWQWLYRTLDASSYLNPHNVDPYFIAQGLLTWKGRMFREVNDLLDRGIKYRKNDWRLPFFKGFNYYYFLDEPEKGAQYLELAARMPESPRETLIVLASRLYSQSARTELAIAIVKDDMEKARDKAFVQMYKTRLDSLYARLKVEQAIETYEKKRKKKPLSIEELVEKGFLNELPVDPEGGKFFLDSRSRVKNSREVAVEMRSKSLNK